jgi:renalase
VASERVAVIGAGLAGLAAAARLRQLGCAVTVTEQSGTVGGRGAPRRAGGWTADHGALYVTAREKAFQSALQEAVFAGRATGWAPRGRGTDEPWLIGLPDMGGLLEPLAAGLDILLHTGVERIGRTSEGLALQTEAAGLGPFDAVLVAVPASQALALLEAHGKPFNVIAEARMAPTLAVVAAFDSPVAIEEDILRDRGPLSAAVRNNSKVGRGAVECWVLHGRTDWSEARLGDPEGAGAALLEALRGLAGGSLPPLLAQETHLWRHAHVEAAVGTPCLVGANQNIAACGDWCLGPRAEAAFISGRAAAEALIA